MTAEGIAILFIFLLIAMLQDMRRYRISNKLIVIGAVSGVMLNMILPAEMEIKNAANALAGMAAGLLIFLPFYMLKVMGAGDVKLMAMIGAFSGPQSIPVIAIYTIICGGILSLIVVAYRGELLHVALNIWFVLERQLEKLKRKKTSDRVYGQDLNLIKFPFSIAIAAGTAMYLIGASY